MSRFANARFANARFATVLAVSLALLVSGVVAGAAGQALIIGSANQAGVSNTSLDTTSSGFAWQMYQHGTGVGVFAISDNGVALAALAHNGNQHALSVTNDGAAGTGAAIIADGKNNTAADLRVNSNAIPPLKVNSTAKVTNLNADSLDGLDGSALLLGNVLTVTHSTPLPTGSSPVAWFTTSIVQPAGHVLTSNVAGNVTATVPLDCGGSGFGDILVFIDGWHVASRTVIGPAGSTVTLPLWEELRGISFATPAADTGRTVEVAISDTCLGASENVVFHSLTLNFVLAG